MGDPEVLRRAGIPEVVADVQYEDHHLLLYTYRSSLDPHEIIDGIMTGALNPAELIQSNHKSLGWNAQDVTCKFRPSEKDVASLGPAFQEVWDEEFRDNPNRPLMVMALVNW